MLLKGKTVTNLILIDCHDLGQHLGCYGWESVPSPNLNDLAQEGVRFENSFCTAPQCSPSRAALYTGRFAHANGMLGLAHSPFNWRLHPKENHLAHLLRQAGFATTLIGVQHVTENKEIFVQALGFEQVFLETEAEVIGDRASAFLHHAPQQPFFLNIGFLEPHRDENGHFLQAPSDSSLGVDIPSYLPSTPAAQAEFAELQGVIGQMDKAIGTIRQALTETDLLKDTWIIFTTDHGLAMPRAKCTLYDPGIETALIMLAKPFDLTGGRVQKEMISNVDIVPTILDMLGIELPGNLHGKSCANLLRNLPHSDRSNIFAEKTFHTAYEPQRAIRTTRYKLIWNVEAGILNVPGDIMHSAIFPQMIDIATVERPPLELYDLAQDPLEQNNLIDNPELAGISRDLRERLLNWMRETDDPILLGPVPSPFFQRGLRLLTKDLP